MLHEVIAVLGGGLGAILRYITTHYFSKYLSFSYLGTAIVNIISCLLMGLILGFSINKINLPQEVKLFLTFDFLGGLTTFSTFSFKTYHLIRDVNAYLGILYLGLECIFCLIFTYLGYQIGKI